MQHVLQPQLQGVHSQLFGDPVHLPLVGSGHLRDAEAPIGGAQRLVGHVHIGIHLGVGDLVGAVGGKARVVVHPGIGGDIGTGIPLDVHLLGGEGAVPLHAGLHVDVDRGAAHGGGKLLIPAVGQLHRAALGLQREGHGDGLALCLVLAAEAAADLRDRKAHLLHGHMEGLGDQPPVAEGGLGGHPDVDLDGDGVRLGGGGVGLNGGVLQHPAGEVALHNLIRLGEAGLHISLFQVVLVADVGALDREAGAGAVVLAPVLMDQHLIFHGSLQVVDHRQLLILHPDQSRGLPGDLLGVGRHGGHRLPLVADLLPGHDGLIRDEGAEQCWAVRAGDHRPDTGQRGGLLRVNPQNAGVGIGAAGHCGIQLPGQIHIRAILGGAGDLGDAALPDLCMADDPLFSCGILPVDHQTVPVTAFLHHGSLLSSLSSGTVSACSVSVT